MRRLSLQVNQTLMTALAKMIDIIQLLNKLMSFHLLHPPLRIIIVINLGHTFGLVWLAHHPEIVLLSLVVFIDFQVFPSTCMLDNSWRKMRLPCWVMWTCPLSLYLLWLLIYVLGQMAHTASAFLSSHSIIQFNSIQFIHTFKEY